MRLTTYTDYALRTLIYLGLHRDRLVTIQDIADAHLISKNHLMKVVYQLGTAELIDTVRGRNGGLRLKQEPSAINIGAVVRWSENDFFIAECFDRENNHCALSSNCKLKNLLGGATDAFLKVLDDATLEDLLVTERSRNGEMAASPIRFFPAKAAKA